MKATQTLACIIVAVASAAFAKESNVTLGENATNGSTGISDSIVIGNDAMVNCESCATTVAIGNRELHGEGGLNDTTSINDKQLFVSKPLNAFCINPNKNSRITDTPFYYLNGVLYLNSEVEGGMIGKFYTGDTESYIQSTNYMSRYDGSGATTCRCEIAITDIKASIFRSGNVMTNFVLSFHLNGFFQERNTYNIPISLYCNEYVTMTFQVEEAEDGWCYVLPQIQDARILYNLGAPYYHVEVESYGSWQSDEYTLSIGFYSEFGGRKYGNRINLGTYTYNDYRTSMRVEYIDQEPFENENHVISSKGVKGAISKTVSHITNVVRNVSCKRLDFIDTSPTNVCIPALMLNGFVAVTNVTLDITKKDWDDGIYPVIDYGEGLVEVVRKGWYEPSRIRISYETFEEDGSVYRHSYYVNHYSTTSPIRYNHDYTYVNGSKVTFSPIITCDIKGWSICGLKLTGSGIPEVDFTDAVIRKKAEWSDETIDSYDSRTCISSTGNVSDSIKNNVLCGIGYVEYGSGSVRLASRFNVENIGYNRETQIGTGLITVSWDVQDEDDITLLKDRKYGIPKVIRISSDTYGVSEEVSSDGGEISYQMPYTFSTSYQEGRTFSNDVTTVNVRSSIENGRIKLYCTTTATCPYFWQSSIYRYDTKNYNATLYVDEYPRIKNGNELIDEKVSKTCVSSTQNVFDSLGGMTFKMDGGQFCVYTNGVKIGTLTFTPTPAQ